MKKSTKNKFQISEERRTHDLLSVGAMLKPLAKSILGSNGFTEIDLLSNWNELAGDMAEYTLPKYLTYTGNNKQNGVLHIEVPSGAFALELQHREKILINKINCFFGRNAVSSLKISQNPQFPIKDIESVGNIQKKLVTADEENYIIELSQGISNQDLQDHLISLGKHIIGNNKDKVKNEV